MAGALLTDDDGRKALQDHIVDKAAAARELCGGDVDYDTLLARIADGSLLRFPLTICFSAEGLEEGEFSVALQTGSVPAEGYTLIVHPFFEGREDDLVFLIAYHLVRVNYGDIASHVEAELYGATLLGMEVDDYYQRVCDLADELLTSPSP